jgi:hypothetical protein
MDLNDVDALIANLVDAFRKAVLKGVKVRVDESGEMFVTHKDVERAHVDAAGVTAEIDGERSSRSRRSLTSCVARASRKSTRRSVCSATTPDRLFSIPSA